ncbi:class II fructose-bisphosphate aldolase [Fannyhessea vaginae]|jgi:fructose-bisphosphate aldolase|uniref:class II fructose-bisphosphate aldolase n=1 Tax=Fannyhessea vaginae TaxID=82135 RepID=UPI0023F14ECA|nr:class II fructose-bisphosphate aldolase [Fannyhessea vaginae]
MLISLRDICAIAEQNSMAIAAFNTPSLEAVRAALDAAEQTGYPVILAHAEGHEHAAPLKYIGPAMVALAEQSSAMVCVHLDHCEHLSYLRRALDMGFTGAMFDGSYMPYEVNVENSARAAEICAPFGAGLECELGSMGSREAGYRDEGGTAEESGAVYTDPDQAEDFIRRTGLDILACSFGTVHGIYKGEPHLNLDVLRDIRSRIKLPLVMHGGSGVSDEDYRKSIDAGIRKINYYTYGVKFAGEAVCNLIADRRRDRKNALVYWHDMTPVAYERMLEDFTQVIKVFANGANPVA